MNNLKNTLRSHIKFILLNNSSDKICILLEKRCISLRNRKNKIANINYTRPVK